MARLPRMGTTISASKGTTHYGRFWGKQRSPCAVVEVGATEVRQCDGQGDHRLPPSSWNQQMEQDRASALFLHHHELAWQTTGELGNDCQPHRLYTNEGRLEGQV